VTDLPDLLADAARRRPAAPALLLDGRILSYADLERRAARLAGWLAQRGVGPGDRVAAFLPPGLGLVATLHALWRLGAAFVPLHTRLTVPELADQIRRARPRLVLRAPGVDLPVPVETVTIDEADPPGADPAPARAFPGDAVAAVVFTSGTTGAPKGALLTRANFVWSAVASALNLGLLPGDRWLLAMPPFHVGGLSVLLRAALYGIPVVLHRRFDPEAVNEALDRGEASIVSVVPTMLRRMLDARGDRPYPPSLRVVLLGGGPAAPELIRRSLAADVPVVPSYGLTETASQVVAHRPGTVAGRVGTAGRPLPFTRIAIAEPDAPLEPGREGEILVAGPTVFAGYLDDPEATRAALRDGWLHTGDIGYLDPEGHLVVLDRRRDLILRGGENVYPAEVEAALLAHPAVADAGVYPLPDPDLGQVPAALVVARSPVTVDSLQAFLAERLAPYKRPVAIRFVPDLPRNSAGKLLRHRLPGWKEGESPACAPTSSA
jgi:O-succinylbenzoic acid--CoA ligase